MKKLSALIALSLLASSAVYAQDGGSCANAITITSNQTVNSDTTGSTNWIGTFGPLVSPSNDVMYTFTITGTPSGSITPTVSDYPFAMYLLTACVAGAEAAPIGATGTIGTGIPVATLTNGSQYWLAVTGTAAGGPAANGTLTFTTPTFPVTLQSFEIN